MGRKTSEKNQPTTRTKRINNTDPINKTPQLLTKDEILKAIKLNLKCKSENQKKFVKLINTKEVIISAGMPGTGKTFITCHQAIELLKNNPTYEKIVLVKSVTTLKNEEIGYLKGGLDDKMEPFVYSFIHNFNKIIGKPFTDILMDQGVIDVLPIAYMRGINIDNAIIIIDEVQNISIDNIRTILTRLGSNSKMILLGDLNQIDLKNKKDTALKFLLDNFSKLDEIGLITLGYDDIVRNPLIKKIEEIFSEVNYNL